MQKKFILNQSGKLLGKFYLPLAIITLCAVFELANLQQLLQYDREKLANGEYWLLLTANFVHLSRGHYFMNMAALWIIWLMFGDLLCPTKWLLLIFISAFTVGAGVHILEPQIDYYVGLSGVLHGLIIGAAVLQYNSNKPFALAVLALTIFKIIYEQLYGALPGSEQTAGGYVLVNAHLYGAIAGAGAALLLLLAHRGGKA